MNADDIKFAGSLELPRKKKKKLIKRGTVLGTVVFSVLFVASVLVLAVVFFEALPAEPVRPWWVKKPMYRILVESFQDSNGDGLGDLEGVRQRLDYLSELGVGSLWLSNILENDVTKLTLSRPKLQVRLRNHTALDAVLGALEDMKELTTEAATKGITIVIDINPLWTSISHRWFAASREEQFPYSEYYIWSNTTHNISSPDYFWQFDRTRSEYYLCQATPEIAVLNLNSEDVQQEIQNVFQFWMNFGVAAFNIGPISEYIRDPFNQTECLYVTEPVERVWNKCNGRVSAVNVWAQFLHSKKATIFGYWNVDDSDVPSEDLSLRNLLDFIVNLRIPSYLGFQYTGSAVANAMMSWVDLVKSSKTVWMLGDEDTSRTASASGSNRVLFNLVLQVLLPGGSAVYYGEELGLPNNLNVTTDLERSRTPMLWSNGTSSGFSTSKPWLPVHRLYEELCVQSQMNQADTSLKTFLHLTTLREEYRGKQYFTALLDNYVAFSKWKLFESDAILILMNFSRRPIMINMLLHSLEYETDGIVLISSQNSAYSAGQTVDMTHLEVQPNDLLVIQYYPVTNGLEIPED